MNGFGAVAFLAGLDSGDPQGDLALATIPANATAASLRVLEGEGLPDGNGAFAQFGQVRINNAGAIAFSALVRDTAGVEGSSNADDSGVFVHDQQGTRGLVREGGTLGLRVQAVPIPPAALLLAFPLIVLRRRPARTPVAKGEVAPGSGDRRDCQSILQLPADRMLIKTIA